MDQLSVTTILISVITSLAFFTMPVALGVLNRVKNQYGSSYYMDVIEEIMGFKIIDFFCHLLLTLIILIGFDFFVSSSGNDIFTIPEVRMMEGGFSLIFILLLVRGVNFIGTILQATRSDKLVVEHLVNKITVDTDGRIDNTKEIELLIQVTCYNIENTTAFTEESIENRLFGVIEKAYLSQTSTIKDETIKKLLDGLAVALTSARNTDNRKTYVYLQRNYAKHLILFFDRKVKNYDVFDRYSEEFYEESIKELGSGHYWLMKADFLISVNMWDIRNPQTIIFIDRIIRNLIDFAARETGSFQFPVGQIPSIL